VDQASLALVHSATAGNAEGFPPGGGSPADRAGAAS